ncbi:hypothetical protein RJ640_029474, partial [Escallonia rubra]
MNENNVNLKRRRNAAAKWTNDDAEGRGTVPIGRPRELYAVDPPSYFVIAVYCDFITVVRCQRRGQHHRRRSAGRRADFGEPWGCGVKWVIKADKHKNLKFCCLQSKAAEPYMRVCGVDREDVLRRFLFIEGPGLYHQGSTVYPTYKGKGAQKFSNPTNAALKVLSYLPLPYSALSSLLIVPTPLRDAVYDYVAKRRYDWFGKDDDCLVLQEKELLERFIDRDEMMDKGRSN